VNKPYPSVLCDSLEPRRLLDGGGEATGYWASYAGNQPEGPLTGHVVYVSAGHGYAYDSSFDAWRTGRGLTNRMVEDFGNQDQLQYYADYLWRAGATVVPLRPLGNQINEVIVDNDDLAAEPGDAGVSYDGNWSSSGSPVFYGDAGDEAYRFAATSSTESAVATYRPDLPEAGIYPVYTWVLDGGNRANQLYTVAHSGGTSEVRVDHRLVGKGWVYLGSYHFDAGTEGSVQISNQRDGSGGSVVIADAIRFGNGMGGIQRPGGVSGVPREDEASLYWLEAMVGQGTSFSSLRTVFGDDEAANVGTPATFAAHMNAAPFGQAVYLGYHSNATANGTARGTVSLINSGSGGATPNQATWATLTANEVEDDLVALTTAPNNLFEHVWAQRPATLASSFGEIRNSRFGGEMDATILEVAFHDNPQDAELMRDPKVRDAVGRSSYQATVRYFDSFSPLAVTPMMLPDVPRELRATTSTLGNIDLSWRPGTVSGATGDAATSFAIYASIDGQGFSPIQEVSSATTSITLSAPDLAALVPGASFGDAFFFRVEATNTGGRSLPSRVVGARARLDVEEPRVLLVNAFDRIERSQNPTNNRSLFFAPGNSGATGGTYERVNPRLVNTFDYIADAGRAVAAFGDERISFNAVENEAVADGTIALSDYDAVIWLAGEESTVNETFSLTEQAAVASYVANGGKLFASGAEIGWDLVARGSTADATFFADTLKAIYVSDDAGTYDTAGQPGSIFDGLLIGFSDGTDDYDVDFPDRLAPVAGGTAALTYLIPSIATAGVTWSGGTTSEAAKVVTLGFGFESIRGEADRHEVMSRVLGFFNLDSQDTQAPTVLDAGFDFETAQGIRLVVDEDVAASLAVEDLTLLDLDSGVTVEPAIDLQVGPDGRTAFWRFVEPLANGNYRAVVPAGSVTDAAGNSLVQEVMLEFFVLAGDATRDRQVSLADFTTLRSNFGRSDEPLFSEADFNYDGVVDLADFTILRSNFAITVATPAGSLFTDETDEASIG
jgi:hypothetical protein